LELAQLIAGKSITRIFGFQGVGYLYRLAVWLICHPTLIENLPAQIYATLKPGHPEFLLL
jgi:hypothetical protein